MSQTLRLAAAVAPLFLDTPDEMVSHPHPENQLTFIPLATSVVAPPGRTGFGGKEQRAFSGGFLGACFSKCLDRQR